MKFIIKYSLVSVDDEGFEETEVEANVIQGTEYRPMLATLIELIGQEHKELARELLTKFSLWEEKTEKTVGEEDV